MATRLSDVDWFEWNGVKCTDYGMRVLTPPSVIIPSERIETVPIPGRSGSLTLLENAYIYDEQTLACTCVIDDPFGLVKLLDFATGFGANLLDFTAAKGGTASGLTTTINGDGTYSSTGTATASTINIWLLGGYQYKPSEGRATLMTLYSGRTYVVNDCVLFGYYASETALISIAPGAPITPTGDLRITGIRHTAVVSGKTYTGQIFYPAVYSDSTTTISRVGKIGGWLRGKGQVTFANRTDGFYNARIANQISFDQIVRGNPHRSFQVMFRCSPFFHLTSGTAVMSITSSPEMLTNLGNIPSEPLIRLTGTGEGTIMCGGSTLLVDMANLPYLMLDCEAKIAYKGVSGSASDPLTLLGTRVTGEWLTIPTGVSYFSFTGNITSVQLTPRWRCA